MDQGLRYVYTGNIHDTDGGATYCPNCQKPVIQRNWYEISSYVLQNGNQCPHCGTSIAGRFDVIGHEFVQFGRQRIPVQFQS